MLAHVGIAILQCKLLLLVKPVIEGVVQIALVGRIVNSMDHMISVEHSGSLSQSGELVFVTRQVLQLVLGYVATC